MVTIPEITFPLEFLAWKKPNKPYTPIAMSTKFHTSKPIRVSPVAEAAV